MERTVLIMRHAERPEITHPDQAEHTMLTPKGLEQAERLGAGLLSSRSPQRIFHSTVPRCQQTAHAIMVGMEKRGVTPENGGPRPELAAPYLPDPPRTYAYSFRLGLDSLGFIQSWFSGRVDRSLADDPRQAALQQLAFFRAAWQKTPGFHLHVSHDWNILLLTWAFMDVAPSEETWPRFLEGIGITFGSDAIVFRFRKQHKSIPNTVLQHTSP